MGACCAGYLHLDGLQHASAWGCALVDRAQSGLRACSVQCTARDNMWDSGPRISHRVGDRACPRVCSGERDVSASGVELRISPDPSRDSTRVARTP